jgi:hypothetical protein
MPQHRKQLTDQERAERRARDREYARQAVEQLRRSEGWQRWLTTRASFTTYSLGNQLLISMQHPTATRVAGFRAWLKLGYVVTKRPAEVPEGEWAIRIWAPCPPSRKQLERWQQSGANLDQRPRTFFKLACVYAQDQVTPLPPPAVPAPFSPPMRDMDGEELGPRIPSLTRLATELGVGVRFDELPGDAHGSYEIQTRRITIDANLSANAKVKTFCHELAHALVRLDRDDADPELDYAAEELVAESVAFTCVRSLGIAADEYSIPYLASWAESAELDTIERTAGLIDRLASRIETALHSEPADTVEEDLADTVGIEEAEAVIA